MARNCEGRSFLNICNWFIVPLSSGETGRRARHLVIIFSASDATAIDKPIRPSTIAELSPQKNACLKICCSSCCLGLMKHKRFNLLGRPCVCKHRSPCEVRLVCHFVYRHVCSVSYYKYRKHCAREE